MFSNPFKLEQLIIKAYHTANRQAEIGKFVVPFNPASLRVQHGNRFQPSREINSAERPAKFATSDPNRISLKFIFDGSGVHDFDTPLSLLGAGEQGVSNQIQEFLDLCFHLNGDIHEPNYLKILWGDGILKDFNCRLESVEINYTSFNNDGTILRAELDAVFIQDTEKTLLLRKEGRSSPDVAHSRVVKSGDTLPLLCKEIYGSAQHYLRIAAYNNLDNFRDLAPGQTLIFPPLEAEK